MKLLENNPIYTSVLVMFGLILTTIVSIAIFQPDFAMSRQGLELKKKINWAKALSISVVFGSLGAIVVLIMKMEKSEPTEKEEPVSVSSISNDMPRITGIY